MREVQGNLWSYPAEFRGISTNGSVNAQGKAVMGRGCALEATIRYPSLATELAERIKRQGNRVHYFDKYALFSLPVKYKWNEKADLKLIKDTVDELDHLMKNAFQGQEIVVPRLGCGNGGLEWIEVEPLMQVLPNNVCVITWRPRA